MKTQQDVKKLLYDLIETPSRDPVGFKREALLEYADRNTITYLQNVLRRKKMKGKLPPAHAAVIDWNPVRLEEEEVHKHLFNHFQRAWNNLKHINSNDKHVTMLRILDKIETAFWILEDQEAIDFIRTPDEYERSAVMLMTWLSNRYDFVPS